MKVKVVITTIRKYSIIRKSVARVLLKGIV